MSAYPDPEPRPYPPSPEPDPGPGPEPEPALAAHRHPSRYGDFLCEECAILVQLTTKITGSPARSRGGGGGGFEDAARRRKASAIAKALRQMEVTRDDVANWRVTKEWAEVARGVGVNRPSGKTVKVICEMLPPASRAAS